MTLSWTAHARARYMALRLLSGRHGLLRARSHLRVPAIAWMSLALLLGMLLLALELWGKLRRAMLAVLLLHMRCEALVGTGSRHQMRARAGRPSISVRASTLLRHVLHLRLGMRRHR